MRHDVGKTPGDFATMKLIHAAASLATAAALAAATPAAAQETNVVFGGNARTDPSPVTLSGFVAFDPNRPGQPRSVFGDFGPVTRGDLTFAVAPAEGREAVAARTFRTDQLSFTQSRIEDSLNTTIRVNEDALNPGERAELRLSNDNGGGLTFPAYTRTDRGFTTASFLYSVDGRGVAGIFTNLYDNRASGPAPSGGTGGATPVPEPAPFALFGIAIAVFVAARRYARPRAD